MAEELRTVEHRVGDPVVYAGHGVGRVVALEPRSVAGTERECIVVDLATGLRVTLPVGEASARLRPVADGAELERVGLTLAVRGAETSGPWTRRVKETRAKLISGTLEDLAEIVRDGAGRTSHGERRMYLQARALLVREICAARAVDPEEADGWIDAQMGSSAKGGS